MKQPDYYKQNGFSPIDAFSEGLISETEYIGFLKGNVIKYVIRAGAKDDAITDLKKAKHYLDFYLELLQEKTSTTETDDNYSKLCRLYNDSDKSDDEIKKEAKLAIVKAFEGLDKIKEVK